MIYELATIEELQAVYDMVQHTIKTVYPKYYPAEVVVFFCELHSKEAIKRDIENGYVSVLKIDGNMIGTGCFADNHITRVYVLPEHQKMGYGTFIIKNIEAQIMEKYDKAYLDASLPAAALYEKLGFSTIKHERYPVENGVILAYEVMEKELNKASTDICYDGRRFIPKMNSLSEREQKIYNMICENLQLSVEQVMAELDISISTVFRDYAKIKKVTGAVYDKKTSTWTL